MNFQLTEEQLMLQQTIRDFAQSEIAPLAHELDEESRFPTENIRKMGEMGLMGMMVPAEFGGGGMGALEYVIALEEIAAACASTAVTMSVNNSLFLSCLMQFASEAQQKKYIPAWAQGAKLGAYSLSEPGSGSDAGALRCAAAKSGGKYLLNGTKNWITNGPNADAMIVFARTSDDKHKGISAFIVEKTFPGFQIGKIEKKLGIRASSTSELILKNCEVPEENRLGAEGDGFKIAMSTLDGGRIGIGAQALGIARSAFETAVKYSQERQAFGKSINEFQGIQWKIADMAVSLDAARLLVHRAAWMKANNMSVTKEAAMAKLFASEHANDVCREAVQVLGGYGYSREYPVERCFRDAKITEIYEGTSEIQRIVISRQVLKEIIK